MKLADLKKIAVIGAGDMGHGIAQISLMAGYEVNLNDIKQEFVDKGIQRIYDSLDKLASKGKVDAELAVKIKGGRLKGFVSLLEAVSDVDMVIEVVPERMDIKKTTLEAIDRYAPAHAIIATNTSTMSITTLATATKRPESVVGTHFFNPAVLMKLVEVIKGDKTSEETAQFACDYVKKIGKVLAYAKKDTPGFIANRIVAPVVVYNGLMIDKEGITAADIDLSMMSIGQIMGPMELYDYTGIDVTAACQEYYNKHLDKEYEVPAILKSLLAENKLGKKTGSGFYNWPERGRPQIDEALLTGKYDIDIPFFIQANESSKLVEAGVCSFEECDNAMLYGYNTAGPIDFIKKFEPEYVSRKLTEISQKFGKKIFAPTKSIKNGSYK